MKAWLTSPDTDFRFAVRTNTGKLLLAAKEGSATGYPAELTIDTSEIIGNAQLGTGLDPTKLGAGTVNATELAYLDGTTAPLQSQINQIETDLGEFGLALKHSVQPALTALTEELAATRLSLLGKVNRAGDAMTGLLALPLDGLTVSGSQLATLGGKVGIGTDQPIATLDVRGDVRFGPTSEYLPAALEESVRIIRGIILVTPEGNYSVESGIGFTVNRLSVTDVKVSFTRPFSAPPTVIPSRTLARPGNFIITEYTREIAAAEVTLVSSAETLAIQDKVPGRIHFIAIGPR